TLCCVHLLAPLAFPTRRSSDLHCQRQQFLHFFLTDFVRDLQLDGELAGTIQGNGETHFHGQRAERDVIVYSAGGRLACDGHILRSEEHTSELQSPDHLVSRLLL